MVWTSGHGCSLLLSKFLAKWNHFLHVLVNDKCACCVSISLHAGRLGGMMHMHLSYETVRTMELATMT